MYKKYIKKNIVISPRFHVVSIFMVKDTLAYSSSKKFRGKYLINVKVDYKFFLKIALLRYH